MHVHRDSVVSFAVQHIFDLNVIGCRINVCPICRLNLRLEQLVMLKERCDDVEVMWCTICVTSRNSSFFFLFFFCFHFQPDKLERHWQPSAKLTALLGELRAMMADSDDDKCVVFSQWSSMLDLVGVCVQQ